MSSGAYESPLKQKVAIPSLLQVLHQNPRLLAEMLVHCLRRQLFPQLAPGAPLRAPARV